MLLAIGNLALLWHPKAVIFGHTFHLFDVGFGGFNFSWRVAERAWAQGFFPDIISSDLQQFNVAGPAYSLANVMTCFLKLGMTLQQAQAIGPTAEYDPLRDEGEYYADALRKAGVPVQMKRWDGMNHGFFFFPGLVDKATAATDEACAWVKGIVG